MGTEDYLVKNAESTVRKSEVVGERCLYLSFQLGAEVRERTGAEQPFVMPIKLPSKATNVTFRGPGTFETAKGEVYGVQIEFNEEGREYRHRKTIKLPHPVVDVQLLDREPDEAYREVA